MSLLNHRTVHVLLISSVFTLLEEDCEGSVSLRVSYTVRVLYSPNVMLLRFCGH